MNNDNLENTENLENAISQNNKPNLKDKIKNSQIYQRLIYRPFNIKSTRSGISWVIYTIIGMIVFWIFFTIIEVKPKLENELYRTDGTIIEVKNTTSQFFNRRGSTRPKIKILTDFNETITFTYIPDGIKENREKITNKYLKNKRVTIYSNIFPKNFNKPIIEKIVMQDGEILSEYYYEWQQSVRNYAFSYKPILISLILLILIYLINGKNTENFSIKNYIRDRNLNSNKNKNSSQTKE